MATDQICDASIGLPMATTPQEAENLLTQTQEALELPLQFNDIFDIAPAVDVVKNGRLLNPLQLNAVIQTLEGALRIQNQINNNSQKCSALKVMAQDLNLVPKQLLEAVRICVDSNGTLLDRASARLGKVRQERRENMEILRKEIEAYAQFAHSRGLSERPIVVIRRDRLCIPVKNGRQSEMDKGSMQLDVSSSGSTIYMEPAPVIDYNNFEAVLKSEEEEETTIILTALSSMMAQYSGDILKVINCITNIDVVYARAGHAKWMNSKRPSLTPQNSNHLIHISQIRHPLLLQPSLPLLPDPTNHTQYTLEDNFMGPLTEQKNPKNQLKNQRKLENPPKPINIHIENSVNVIAVTGPNTGGKTAMLKTLGLCVLMSKCGLFLPTLEGSVVPQVVWFDDILADIGDGQSLQQNLSTFSGHVKRIVDMLEEVGEKSLVLLDEIGSGTNPQEGAALAQAVLKRLSGSARLTVATTHHSELKEMANLEENFINASVEFDVETLKPTYEVSWGTSGSSNALAIARSLNFDRSIVNNAQNVLLDLKRINQSYSELVNSESLVIELDNQVQQANASIQTMKESSRNMEEEVENLEKIIQQQTQEIGKYSQKNQDGDAAFQKMKDSLESLLKQYQDRKISLKNLSNQLDSLEQEALGQKQTQKTASQKQSSDQEKIRPGDEVKIITMMGKIGKVISTKSDEELVVKVGALTMEVDVNNVQVVKKEDNQIMKKLSQQSSSQQEVLTQKQDVEVTMQTSANTVNVIGMEGFQAILEVDRFLSYGGNLLIYVVHGVGEGKVRSELHQWLSKNPKVDKFQIEQNSLGGTTQVKLKPSKM